jgi:hypothetical protein
MVMAAMVMVVMVVVAVSVVLIARHGNFFLAALSSIRPNLTGFTVVVVLAIARASASNSNLPGIRSLLANDNGCRRGLLEDDLLLGGALPNDDRGGRWRSGLVVLSLLAPTLNLGGAAGVAIVAAFFNPALDADFAAVAMLDPLLDAHFCLLFIIPVRAALPIPGRVDVVAVDPFNLFGGLVHDPPAVPVMATMVVIVTVPLHDLPFDHGSCSLSRVWVPVIALDNSLALYYRTPTSVPAVLYPVNAGVVLIPRLALALALNDLALDVGCAVGRGVKGRPGSLRDVQAIDATVDLDDLVAAGAANGGIAAAALLLDDIDLALYPLDAIRRHLVTAHCRSLVALIVGRRSVPLPHIAGLAVHLRHGGGGCRLTRSGVVRGSSESARISVEPRPVAREPKNGVLRVGYRTKNEKSQKSSSQMQEGAEVSRQSGVGREGCE